MMKAVSESSSEGVPQDELRDGQRSPESRLIARARAEAERASQRLGAVFARHQDRPLVDVAARIYARDRDAAGTLVGSAIAFRLFLFFAPLLLFMVGLAGFLSAWIGSREIERAGITGSLAGQINDALNQSHSTRWIATALGLVGMVMAGRALSKVMSAASCLSWGLPVRARARARALGAVVGFVVGIALVSLLINKIRHEFGLAAAGLSFVAALAVYTIAWLLVSLVFPRATPDPGAVLPGAVLVGLTLAGLQAFSQLYLPGRIEKASELYGAIGTTLVTLGWFFIMGRVIVLSMTLNAVIYERFGSISTFVFDLPGIRALPRRWPRLRRFFDLPDQSPADLAGGLD